MGSNRGLNLPVPVVEEKFASLGAGVMSLAVSNDRMALQLLETSQAVNL